eukprot:jgi/Chrpa1/20409/Chrysochromulina_OHIO_Genome00007078-RA
MPELPEVETARNLLATHCVSQRITMAVTVEGGGGPRDGLFDEIVFDDKEADAAIVSSLLEGKQLVEVRRRGKQLWLVLSSPPHLLAHFGMTGAFVVRGVAAQSYKEFRVHDEAWPPRFTKLELQFEAGNALAFCDPRRLGRLRLRADPQNEEPWRSLAPDPLIDPIEKGRWLEVLAAKGCNIKALLLDQAALVSGVGNWVADEVLFHAGVHPEAICRSLSDAQIDRLRAALTHVLNVAVSCGAKDEEFPRDWLFHYRWGKVPGTVPGERGGAITFLTVGGRTSAVVLSRQRKGDAPLKADAAEAGEYAAVKPKKQRGAKKEAAPAVEEPATGEGSGAARALEDELVAHWQGPGGGGSSSSKRKSRAVDVRAEEDAVGAVTGASGRRKKASKKAQ